MTSARDETARKRSGLVILLLVLLALAGSIGLAKCAFDSLPEESARTPEETRRLLARWHEGISAFDRYDFADAGEIFEELAAALPEEADAWANAGLARMNQALPDTLGPAQAHYEKALELDPDHMTARFGLGVLLKHIGEFEEAERAFHEVLARDPDAPTANYYLAVLLLPQGPEGQAEAERLLRHAIREEPHQASALKNLSTLLRRTGRRAESTEFLELFRRFNESETGNRAGIVYSEMGRYGDAIRRFPLPVPQELADTTPISFEEGPAVSAMERAPFVVPAGITPRDHLLGPVLETFGPGLALSDVDGDGDLDLWLADGRTLGRLFLNEGGTLQLASEAFGLDLPARSVSAVFGDVNQDDRPDLFVACAGPDRLLLHRGDRFEDVSAEAGIGGGEVFSSQGVLADHDADGDVDLFVATLGALSDAEVGDGRTAFPGAPDRLFINRGDGSFEDVAPELPFGSAPTRALGALAADADGDRDTDIFLLDADAGPRYFRNDRLWRFTERTREIGLADLPPLRGLAAVDLDGDLRLDLAGVPADGEGRPVLLRATEEGGFRRMGLPQPVPPAASLTPIDADEDGDLDLLVVGASGTALLLQSSPGHYEIVESVVPGLGGAGLRTLLAADLTGDGIVDLAASEAGGARPLLRAGRMEVRGGFVGITLSGVREEGRMRANPGGIGARVTAVAGTSIQMQELHTATGVLGGAPPRLRFGLAGREGLDYAAVHWPDGLLQGETALPAGAIRHIEETYRKSSSCPLLFVEHEGRMRFVTDFLGTGGLGFFLEPGRYAPPDPSERVRVPFPVDRGGLVEMSIHEPMEETCYLDALSLHVVDHEPAFEVHPDERMVTGKPELVDRLLVIAKDEKILPKALVTREGPAAVSRVTAIDRRYQPGVHPDRRFIGYAAPQEITLDFGDDWIAAAREKGRTWMFLNGWVEYPYSHVNFAAWQAGVTPRPLSLDAEVRGQGFLTLLEDFGYPAGLTRTMTVHIPELPEGATGRLRLRTNLELHVDQVFLAEERPDAKLNHRRRPVHEAVLRYGGFPLEYSPDGAEPLLYDYARQDARPEYEAHAGAYTRFGPVAPLLEAADDRYVVFARGEEIRLAFDLGTAPARGRTRTLILDTFGWCKDLNPYTAFPDTLAPLPFQAMKGYPPENPEDAPDFASWMSEWNTRVLPGRIRPK